jgi:hypothetical protein
MGHDTHGDTHERMTREREGGHATTTTTMTTTTTTTTG